MIRLALLGALVSCFGTAVAQNPQENCAGIADPAQRLACYDAVAKPDAPPATPTPEAPANPPAAPADASGFGLPTPEAARPAEQITARIVGAFREWKRGTLFRLDNGQVWKAVDTGRGYYTTVPDNPDVVISRSFWGAYWMEIPAADLKIKVKRIS